MKMFLIPISKPPEGFPMHMYYEKQLTRVDLPKQVVAIIRGNWIDRKEYTKAPGTEKGIWKAISVPISIMIRLGMPLVLVCAALGFEGFVPLVDLSIAVTWALVFIAFAAHGILLMLTLTGNEAAKSKDHARAQTYFFNWMVIRFTVFKKYAYEKWLAWFTIIALSVALAMYGAIFTTFAYLLTVFLCYIAGAVSKQMLLDYAHELTGEGVK
jgi:hypothetical protein